jgi:hypothetical protein
MHCNQSSCSYTIHMACSKKSLSSVRTVYDCGTALLQVKCPECRAEHRIPYQGVQGYPTNVTLQRFLELHIEITGELPDPTSGQIMERCNVCSEKSYCSVCVHCEKKICSDCKGAHMDILRREIARIDNQVSWIFFAMRLRAILRPLTTKLVGYSVY